MDNTQVNTISLTQKLIIIAILFLFGAVYYIYNYMQNFRMSVAALFQKYYNDTCKKETEELPKDE
jgi:hypothetical protein